MLHLKFPNISHKNAYLGMIEEWGAFEKIPTSPMRLFSGKDYEEFLSIVEEDLISGRLPGITATLFFLINEEGKILGALQLRHTINHPNLIETGGHIGYGIRPSERRKGYAKEMLRLGLVEAGHIGLRKVLITCDDDNIGSYKAIEANNGIFERFTEKEGRKMRRYWISVS